MTALWARTPLRIKLVAALLLLVLAALAVSGFAAAASLRRYLIARVDTQLADTARRAGGGGPGPGGIGGRPGDGPRGDDLPTLYYVRRTGPAGAVQFETPLADPGAAPALPALTVAEARGRRGRPYTVRSVDGDGEWRVTTRVRPDGGAVTVARDLSDENATVARLVFLEVVIGATVLLVLGGIGYVVVRRSLKPLADVEATAAAISAGDLSHRVPETDPRTEVGAVAAALNAMLQQIETAFRERSHSEAEARRSEQRMRRFVADASHELRTPLTSIRGFAELYRQGAADDVPRLMRRIEDEGARMGLLVDDLLLLARLDQERPLATDLVDLAAVVADAVHDARALDPERAVTLSVDEEAVVVGDEPRLRQVLGNLLANAVKHTPPGTPVEVRLRTSDGYAVVDVADHGPGLSPEDAARVFERFYRADPSRTRDAGGSGLGLAIVAAIAAAHDGSVSVADTPGGGATFTLRLPLAA